MIDNFIINNTFTFVCDALLTVVQNSTLLHFAMVAFPLIILICGILSSIKGK